MGHQQELLIISKHLTTLNGTPTRTMDPRWGPNTRFDNLKWDTKKETFIINHVFLKHEKNLQYNYPLVRFLFVNLEFC